VFAHFPGLLVVSPSTPADAKGLLKTAIRDDNPVVFIEHKMIYNEKGEVPTGEHFVPLGKAAVRREGKDVTLLGYSYVMGFVLEAATKLASEGIDTEVIDLRSINPLDMETIAASIRKTHRCVIVHEAHTTCGFGAEIVARVQEQLFDELDAPVLRVGGIDVPVPYAIELESAMLPSVDRICATVRSLR
jgi:pyruvate dehydrogenase E1 component beta subunit